VCPDVKLIKMSDIRGTLSIKRKGTFTDSWPQVTGSYARNSNTVSFGTTPPLSGRVKRVEEKESGIGKRGHRFDVLLEGNEVSIALAAESDAERARWCSAMQVLGPDKHAGEYSAGAEASDDMPQTNNEPSYSESPTTGGNFWQEGQFDLDLILQVLLAKSGQGPVITGGPYEITERDIRGLCAR
jgi:hypothetical protein